METSTFNEFKKALEAYTALPKSDKIQVIMPKEYYELLLQAERVGRGFEAYLLNMLDWGDEETA